jgi:hypothetical protein
MERSFISNTVLAVLVAVTTPSLWALGEGRFDAYISLYALEYLVVKAIMRPKRVSKDYIAVVLVAAFAFFVARRILEVLGS